tara:strand:+ start:330 stop:659 length:330 start_codon:yes stop_codon:yes gene_type:complete
MSNLDDLSNHTKSDLIWKILSVGLVPALIWVNAISNDVAVLNVRVEQAESSIKDMAEDLRDVSKTTTQNASKLEAIQESLTRVHTSISETRKDLRVLNTRLLGETLGGE